MLLLRLPLLGLHGVHHRQRLDRNAGDAGQQVDDLFLVAGKTVDVELFANGGVLGGLFLVLVEDPFKTGPVAKAIGLG